MMQKIPGYVKAWKMNAEESLSEKYTGNIMLGRDVDIWPKKENKNNRQKEDVIFDRKCKIKDGKTYLKKEAVLQMCKENNGNLFHKTEVGEGEINKKHKIICNSKIWRYY